MTRTREWTDQDGDTLSVDAYGDGEPVLMIGATNVLLTRSMASELVEFLQADQDGFSDWHDAPQCVGAGTLPDAEADGYDWPALAPDDTDSPTATSVLLEAQRAVYGDRGEDYGHPRDHWTRTAIIWTGILQSKLADGEHISPEDVGRLYIGDKLARDSHQVKRDNRVDIAGYALCLDRLETGQ